MVRALSKGPEHPKKLKTFFKKTLKKVLKNVFLKIRENFEHSRKVGSLVYFSGVSRPNREGWHLCY